MDSIISPWNRFATIADTALDVALLVATTAEAAPRADLALVAMILAWGALNLGILAAIAGAIGYQD